MSKVMERRCALCGKEISADGAVFNIHRKAARGMPQEAWGRVHEACFVRRVGHPKEVVGLLRQRAEALLEGGKPLPSPA